MEKAAEHDAKWTVDVNATIVRMIEGGSSYLGIASELGNGLKIDDISNRWNRHLKESSGIIKIKPAMQPGETSSITWTADVDAAILRMRTDGDSFPKIASELGNGLKKDDIRNGWTCHMKDKLQ